MTYTVRRVLVQEYPKYRQHLKALDLNSRHLRFGFVAKDDMIDTLCDKFENDPKNHILFCVENDNLEFIAIGHIALGETMELAFSVLKEYQGQGMGDALMKRCIRYCRTQRILTGCMVCLSHNAAIRHLCVKNNIRLHTEYGDTEGDIKLDEPHFRTFLDEALAMQSGMIDYAGKRALLPWTIMSKKLENILK